MTQGIMLLNTLQLLEAFNKINSHTETQSTFIPKNRLPKNKYYLSFQISSLISLHNSIYQENP